MIRTLNSTNSKTKRTMPTQSIYHQTAQKIEEERVWIEAAKKDPARFAPLYNKYHEQIFRFVYQRLDDRELAFDATSQIFLKALTNIHRFEFRGLPFGSWLYRIAKSEVNNMFKSQKARRTINIEKARIVEMVEELEEDLHDEQMAAMVKAIAALKEEDLMLVELRFFEKRPFKEIAEIMELTETNTKVRLYRILDRLKKRISAKMDQS